MRTHLTTTRRALAVAVTATLTLFGVAVAQKVASADPVANTATADGWTTFSTDYLDSDGTHRLDLADQPVNYQTAAGAWASIDNTLVPDAAGGYTNAANA